MLEQHAVTIRPDGTVEFIYADAAAGLLALGNASVTRASHVEPHVGGGWYADMSPVGGPVLLDGDRGFSTRAAALEAEVAWLKQYKGL